MSIRRFGMVTAILVLIFAVGLVPPTAKGEEFGGFGIMVAQLHDESSPRGTGDIVVLYVPSDSEAAKAGILAGDVIYEVDGARLAGRPFGDVVLHSLRGQVGTPAELRIRRGPEGKTVVIRLTRARITYPAGTGK